MSDFPNEEKIAKALFNVFMQVHYASQTACRHALERTDDQIKPIRIGGKFFGHAEQAEIAVLCQVRSIKPAYKKIDACLPPQHLLDSLPETRDAAVYNKFLQCRSSPEVQENLQSFQQILMIANLLHSRSMKSTDLRISPNQTKEMVEHKITKAKRECEKFRLHRLGSTPLFNGCFLVRTCGKKMKLHKDDPRYPTECYALLKQHKDLWKHPGIKLTFDEQE